MVNVNDSSCIAEVAHRVCNSRSFPDYAGKGISRAATT